MNTANGFNYKRDAKSSRQGNLYKPKRYDLCQTPPKALEPLLPYIPTDFKTVWEPAAGEGYLAGALEGHGFTVISSDIITGKNFFEWHPAAWDCLITNPPYSIKYKWLARCYELGRPFALLMPVEMLGTKTAQRQFSRCGVEIILLERRVNFKMPNKGWDGKGAQFPTAWYTWGLGIGRQITWGVSCSQF